MIRGVLSALCTRITPGLYSKSLSVRAPSFISKIVKTQPNANFSSLVSAASSPASHWIYNCTKKLFLESQNVSFDQKRTVIKYSWKKGKRKTVSAVTERFYRLHWGIWIRTIAGRRKKLWKKSMKQKNRFLNHVFCNATQSRMLDKMVNKFWRKPRYYIEDPYEIYQSRENFYITQTKPKRPEGVDYE